MFHKLRRIFLPTRLNRKILSMAIPVFFSMLSNTAIMIADTAMVGKLGALSIASAGFGGIVYFTVLAFLMGSSMGVQILTSRRFGEKSEEDIAKTAASGIYLALVLGSFLSVLGFLGGEAIMDFLGDDPEVIHLSGVYLSYRFAGTVFFFLIFSLRGFFDGIGLMHVGMISSILITVCNIFFNWIFIYGNLGFPAWGVKGAAFASAIAGIPGALVFIFFFFVKDVKCYFRLSYWVPDWAVLKELSYLGFAPALESSLTNVSFVGFTKLAGMLGTIPLAATNIVLTCLSLSFMPGFSFGIAATTILGQAMGAGKIRLAYEGTFRSATFSAIMMGSMGIIFIVFGKSLIQFFTLDPLVLSEAYPALCVVALIQAGDAYHMVVGSALRSAGLMYWVLYAYLGVSFFVMLPCAYFFGIYLGYGTVGLWSSIFIWLFILAVLFVKKFRQKEWVQIRI